MTLESATAARKQLIKTTQEEARKLIFANTGISGITLGVCVLT